jgi:O-antigen ligase
VVRLRDTTLTGRTMIWRYVSHAIRDRPVLGWGFAAYWDDPANVTELNRRALASIDNAHNSFVEIWLGLGTIGLALAVAFVALGVLDHMSDVRRRGVQWSTVWSLALLAFMLVENSTEAMIRYHSSFWVLLVAAVASGSSSRRVFGGGDA